MRRAALDARRKTQVDPAESANAVEDVLRRGDVHHGERLPDPGAGHGASNAQALFAQADLYREILARRQPELDRRGRTEKECVGPQRTELVRAFRGWPARERSSVRVADSIDHRELGRSDLCHPKEIDAEDAQRLVTARQTGLDLQQWACHGHVRVLRKTQIDGIVEASLRADDL